MHNNFGKDTGKIVKLSYPQVNVNADANADDVVLQKIAIDPLFNSN